MLRATPLVLMLLAAPSASAAPQRLAVVELATPPNMAGLGSQLTQIVLRAAQQQGYVIIPPDRIEATLGQKGLVQLQDCGGEPGCVAVQLSSLPVTRAVVGSLGRDERSYLLKLWLVDLEKRQVLSSIDRAILIASRRLIPDATEAIPLFLRGQREATGTLKLSSTVPNARVTVDGQEAGTTPLTLELKPGEHTVRVEKKAYLRVDRLVRVEANQTTEEEVRLLLAPGQKAPEEEKPKVAKAAESVEAGPRVPAAAWAAYVAALGASGGAIYFGTQSRKAEQDLKDKYDKQRNIYLGTRAEALEGQRNTLLANVLFGAAGVALGTAVTLTILENQQGPQVKVTPAPAPGGAALLLHGRF